MSSGAFYAAAAAGDRRNSVPNDTTSAAAGDGQTYEIPPTAGGQPTVAYGQSTTPSSLEGNMAELLEAAAKATTESQRHAAAQQQQQQQQQQQAGGGAAGLRKVARVTDLRGTAMQEEALSAVGQKRKRAVTPPGGGEGGGDIHGIEEGEGQEEGRAGSQSPRKRARQTPTTGVAEMQHHASSADMHHYHHHQQSPTMVHQQEGFGLTDARAVGVHSAAALFRQPSASSAAKKHTRPPMSKLFASLQLTPENFLRLQAAAKTYMLDEAHPERQSCVGSRGKGDTDMVKLRLFNCCRDFLSDGIGERFFGPDVPAPTENEVLEGETMPGRKWVWPRDGNKIVSLVTPLLRRMVTNERQRQYAQETRKGTGKKTKTDTASRDTSSQDAAAAVAAAAAAAAAAASATATTPSSIAPFDTSHSPPNLAIDPSLSTPQPSQPPPTHAPPPNPQPHYPAVAPPQPAPYGPPPTQYPRFLQTQPPQSIYSTAVPPGPHPIAANTDQDHHHQQQHFHHHHQQQPPPDQNVIQVLITKNNTKLLPRIDMPSWPSTPHHTLPLADLRRAIEEEVRGLLKRGLDLGMRRTSPTKTPTMTTITTAPAAAGRARESVAPATTTMSSTVTETQQPADVDMAEAGGEEQQQEPDMNQQKEAPPVKEGVANDGDGSILQSQQQQQQQPLEEEPGIDDITLEIRALTGRGLVLITGDDEWRAVLAEVGRAVWMEGVLRVVVEVI